MNVIDKFLANPTMHVSFWSSVVCLYGGVYSAIWGDPMNAVGLGIAAALLFAGAVVIQPSAVEGFADAELGKRGQERFKG